MSFSLSISLHLNDGNKCMAQNATLNLKKCNFFGGVKLHCVCPNAQSNYLFLISRERDLGPSIIIQFFDGKSHSRHKQSFFIQKLPKWNISWKKQLLLKHFNPNEKSNKYIFSSELTFYGLKGIIPSKKGSNSASTMNA